MTTRSPAFRAAVRTLLLAAATVAAYFLIALFADPARADGDLGLGRLTHPPATNTAGPDLPVVGDLLDAVIGRDDPPAAASPPGHTGSGRATPGSDRATPGSGRATPGSDRATPGSDRATPGSDRAAPGHTGSDRGHDRGTPGGAGSDRERQDRGDTDRGRSERGGSGGSGPHLGGPDRAVRNNGGQGTSSDRGEGSPAGRGNASSPTGAARDPSRPILDVLGPREGSTRPKSHPEARAGSAAYVFGRPGGPVAGPAGGLADIAGLASLTTPARPLTGVVDSALAPPPVGVTQTVAVATSPLASRVAAVTRPAGAATAPTGGTAAGVTRPLAETLAEVNTPAVGAVGAAAGPLAGMLAVVAAPVVGTVAAVAGPLIGVVAPLVGAVVEVVEPVLLAVHVTTTAVQPIVGIVTGLPPSSSPPAAIPGREDGTSAPPESAQPAADSAPETATPTPATVPPPAAMSGSRATIAGPWIGPAGGVTRPHHPPAAAALRAGGGVRTEPMPPGSGSGFGGCEPPGCAGTGDAVSVSAQPLVLPAALAVRPDLLSLLVAAPVDPPLAGRLPGVAPLPG